MANLSDAYGVIRVKRVGDEFLAFLREITPKDAYYTLIDVEQLSEVVVDEQGDIEYEFSNFGRWAFYSNIMGYLNVEWFKDKKEALNKLKKAIADKDGSIEVEYADCDPAMDWVMSGVVTLDKDGLSEALEEESLTLENFARHNQSTLLYALEYLQGDEAVEAFEKYKDECEKNNTEPADIQTWLDEIYIADEGEILVNTTEKEG